MRPLFLATALLSASTALHAADADPWSITLDFSGGGLTASQQAIFGTAADTWDGFINGYLDPIALSGPTISAAGVAIDGSGGILGSAGPTGAVGGANFLVTSTGVMEFDSADLADMETNGYLLDVIIHEMGHVLGIGTLWSSSAVGAPGFQEVYVDGSGEYTGAAGLAAYQAEFDAGAFFVPVELGGGAGTANGHWNEVDNGAGLTGITDGDGNDLRDELMTGWLNTPTFISNTTVQSLADIGYNVIPEPSSLALLAFALLPFHRRRR